MMCRLIYDLTTTKVVSTNFTVGSVPDVVLVVFLANAEAAEMRYKKSRASG